MGQKLAVSLLPSAHLLAQSRIQGGREWAPLVSGARICLVLWFSRELYRVKKTKATSRRDPVFIYSIKYSDLFTSKSYFKYSFCVSGVMDILRLIYYDELICEFLACKDYFQDCILQDIK